MALVTCFTRDPVQPDQTFALLHLVSLTVTAASRNILVYFRYTFSDDLREFVSCAISAAWFLLYCQFLTKYFEMLAMPSSFDIYLSLDSDEIAYR